MNDIKLTSAVHRAGIGLVIFLGWYSLPSWAGISVSNSNQMPPAQNQGFYYQIGGGEAVPPPANTTVVTIPLNASVDVNLGYNCGAFDPTLSMKNLLNGVSNGTSKMEQELVDAATAAIANLPAYVLEHANPELYNLFTNSMFGAHSDIQLATKSCQAMHSDIAQGKNPYDDFATLSVGNDWKLQMSAGDGDIVSAQENVTKSNGNNGLPWVGGTNAGGSNQPPIRVVHDATVAGYNSLLNRDAATTTAPASTADNQELVSTFSTPQAAADWVTAVVGDQSITTCSGCTKSATPGVGLLPTNQTRVTQVNQNLNALLTGQTPLSQQSLAAVSAPGVIITPPVIDALKNMDPNDQMIWAGRLSEEVAMSQTLSEALLARQVLEAGKRDPQISAVGSAQTQLDGTLNQLDTDIRDLMFQNDMRKALVSQTVSQ